MVISITPTALRAVARAERVGVENNRFKSNARFSNAGDCDLRPQIGMKSRFEAGRHGQQIRPRSAAAAPLESTRQAHSILPLLQHRNDRHSSFHH
jgi:hypothetical protein